MKISLTPEAYKTLYNVCQELHTTAGELVSQLVLNYAKQGTWDTPDHACEFCSLKYFSENSLKQHLKRRHGDKIGVKK